MDIHNMFALGCSLGLVELEMQTGWQKLHRYKQAERNLYLSYSFLSFFRNYSDISFPKKIIPIITKTKFKQFSQSQ